MAKIVNMAKIVAVWVFGLLASAIAGNLIGASLTYDGEVRGAFAGIFAFACIRLWITSRSNNSNQPV